MAFRLVVGLGNPGASYKNTRHNAGFEVLDLRAHQAKSTWGKCKVAVGEVAQVPSGELLLKPQTYMNLSGQAVASVLRWYRWSESDVLVVVDDVALPLGTLRLKPAGSSGGHNGLKSVEQCLGTQAYARLRIGVGANEQGKELADHVLSQWKPEEKKVFEEVKKKAVETLEYCQSAGLETAMNFANRKL